MRKTIPLAVVVATLAAVTIVTGLVRNGVDADNGLAVAPVVQVVQTAAGVTPSRLRVNSFGAI